MAKVKATTTVSNELSEWFRSQADKVGIPRTALIAIAMNEYRTKTEKAENE